MAVVIASTDDQLGALGARVNVLSRQCFCQMIGDAATLTGQVAAWESDRNKQQKGVDWQFTTADARIKLKRLYPRIQN